MAQTNGTVGSVAANGDMTLTVNDGTGLKTVLVPSTVPVVTYAPGSLDELKPGANVILFAQKDAAGNLTTGRVQVGKDGLTPPMYFTAGSPTADSASFLKLQETPESLRAGSSLWGTRHARPSARRTIPVAA